MNVKLILFALAIYIGGEVWIASYTRRVEAQTRREPIINCKGGNVIQPLVRDFDGRLWRIDVCAVAQDDAGASQYKTEIPVK